MQTEKRIFGLIGYPLAHSFSKKYFKSKFEKEKIENTEYLLFPLKSIGQLKELLANQPNIKGLNVTIPYKERVIPFLDALDDSATFGAVNTIKIEDGRLLGHNTDVYGFEQSVLPFLSKVSNALVLGTGGASKAVCHVLKQNNITTKLASRTNGKDRITYEMLDKSILSNYQMIINTTPLGTNPNEHTFPDLPYQYLTGKQILVDLVYNPPITQFLFKGAKQGCTTKNGMEMLYLQAEKAWEIWNQ